MNDFEIVEIADISSVFPTYKKTSTFEPQVKTPQWVENFLKEGAVQGERNQAATRLVGHYRTKNISADEAFEILKGFADKCKPQLDYNELWNTVQSVYRYAGNIASAKITEAPEILEEGEALLFKWQQYGLSVVVDQINRERNDLIAEIAIEMEYPGERILRYPQSKINFLAPLTRKNHVNALNSLFKFDWDEVINIVSRTVISRNREGKPFTVLNQNTDEIPPQWLFKPFVLDGETTLLFGDGGMGKSLFALAIASSIHTGANILGITPTRIMKGLYLDWEASALSHKKRLVEIAKGHTIDLSRLNLVYQECVAPLTEISSQIAKRIVEEEIGFVIIDSVAPACGGEPEKAESAIKLFNAARKLKCTVLMLAHVTKSNDTTHKAFGSTYWHNLARSTVEMKRQQDYGEDVIHLALLHRKNNYGRLEHPLGYRIEFMEGKTVIEYENPYQIESIADEMPTKDKIMAVLADGPMTYQAIMEATGLKRTTITSAVNRHQQAFEVTGGGKGKGNEQTVSLKNKAFQNATFGSPKNETLINKGFQNDAQNDAPKMTHKMTQEDDEVVVDQIPF